MDEVFDGVPETVYRDCRMRTVVRPMGESFMADFYVAPLHGSWRSHTGGVLASVWASKRCATEAEGRAWATSEARSTIDSHTTGSRPA